MKLKNYHNTIVTAFLLVLYAFIATPVSYWHYHKHNCDKYETEQNSLTEKKASAAAVNDCKICNHHYSVASNNAITVYFPFEKFFNAHNAAHFISNIINRGYSQSNKGPPAIS